ncbi:hypothetical protein Q9L58_001642 [Maublancomyces gigas]|uniref:Uncharacterized protein n=1 Tax=Discina gigas TaxID=1032678 RepID=A0ABR3GUE9_9PEZI
MNAQYNRNPDWAIFGYLRVDVIRPARGANGRETIRGDEEPDSALVAWVRRLVGPEVKSMDVAAYDQGTWNAAVMNAQYNRNPDWAIFGYLRVNVIRPALGENRRETIGGGGESEEREPAPAREESESNTIVNRELRRLVGPEVKGSKRALPVDIAGLQQLAEAVSTGASTLNKPTENLAVLEALRNNQAKEAPNPPHTTPPPSPASPTDSLDSWGSPKKSKSSPLSLNRHPPVTQLCTSQVATTTTATSTNPRKMAPVTIRANASPRDNAIAATHKPA